MYADLVTIEELKGLMQSQGDTCVSVMMPTRHTTSEALQNPIRFKNLLRQAQSMLADVNHPNPSTLLSPAEALLEDRDFWHHQGNGLAAYFSDGFFHYYRVPIELEEIVVVSDRFHLKPLLSLLRADGRFYLLALSQNEVRLFECTRHTVSEVELVGIPVSLAEALKYDQPERQLQYQTRTPQRPGRRAAVFHGHGGGNEPSKDDILHYFQTIDRGLQQFLPDGRVPLVLAGVEYLFSIYRESNTFPFLMDKGVTGNPEGLRGEELHEPAWKIVEPVFDQARRDEIDRFHALAGTGKASDDFQEVLDAAHYGRVATLFVPVGLEIWGKYNENGGKITLHEGAQPGDQDLLDLAAAQTIMTGGTVYAVEPEEAPSDAPLAAIFRW
ncbi:MAG: hypothetical protein AB1664_09475 [Thermodesulfobacteriota bacterium]